MTSYMWWTTPWRSTATAVERRGASEYEVRLTTDDAAVAAEAMPSRRAREAEQERWQRYQSRVWNAFDRVQVFTERDAATVRDVAPPANRVVVNPFGVDLPELVSDKETVAGNLVFVGGFAHPPNVDAAIWLAGEIPAPGARPVPRRSTHDCRHSSARLRPELAGPDDRGDRSRRRGRAVSRLGRGGGSTGPLRRRDATQGAPGNGAQAACGHHRARRGRCVESAGRADAAGRG
jgi:hypothetical protein